MSVTADREDSRHEERCEGPVAAVRKARAGLAVLLLLACGESPAQNASASGDASRQEVEQPADSGDAPPTDDVAVDGSLADASSDAADPGLLPLLPPGSHIGTIIGFEPLPAGTKASIDANWADAVSKGMDIARVQIDWAEMEPSAGTFDPSALESHLAPLQAQGLGIFLTLSTIDSEGFTLPADLMDASDETKLSGGIPFDDPKILTRFAKLLDWVVPMLVSRGGWAMSVGNEPGTTLDDKPAMTSQVAGFLAAARRHSHSIDPRLAVTMTMRESEVDESAPYLPVLMAECDVACFNYYGQDADVKVEAPSLVPSRIAAMLAVAGSRQLVIQELGCPAGWSGRASTIGGTPETQRAFFEAFFTEMKKQPRVRAAVVFEMVDWSPDLVSRFYVEPLKAAGLPQDFIDKLEESLRTVGLCRYEDGTCRPAWDTFLGHL